MQNLLNNFISEAKEIGAKDEVVDHGAKEIRIAVDRGMQGLRAHNGSVLARHLKAAIKEARSLYRSSRYLFVVFFTRFNF